jgi:hypothetical protein
MNKLKQYPWYAVVKRNVPLEQGDFLFDCPILVPKSIPDESRVEVEAEVLVYNVIVLSQSCDLIQGKVDLVLLCPFWDLDELEAENEMFKGKGREKLRRGEYPGYHLLNLCEIRGFERDFIVVDFRNVYGMPFDFLTKFAFEQGKRLRLLPPYREHLAQAFARFFMRVGLPIDIPPFR